MAERTPIEEFLTADIADEGIRLPLWTRDGRKTDEWVTLRGIDSSAYRAAKTSMERRMLAGAKAKDDKAKDEATREAEFDEEILKLTASLVKAWSFDIPCTTDEVCKVLRKAPQIYDKIQEVTGDRERFFGLASKPSNDTLSSSSDSTEGSQEESKPTESSKSK